MRTVAVVAVALGAAACGKSSDSTGTPAVCTGAVITVPALGVKTVSAADAPCLSMPADGSTYIVVPQFASGTGSGSRIGYEIGTNLPAAMDASPMIVSAGPGRSLGLQAKPRGARQALDFTLRERERRLAMAHVPAAKLVIAACCAVPTLGSTRIFDVLSTIAATAAYKKDTATVQYVGSHIVIYISNRAPSGGLSAGDITALGNTFDADLYGIDTAAFGAPSDIDLNGRVLVLMSPVVNSLVTTSQCMSGGYVGGFFSGLDLEPSQPHSNGSEVFFSIVADPAGTLSCAHSVAAVKATLLSTFIHEFQHMISWNQHVILRSGPPEDVWLNEGMSHLAEELGSRYYEHKYPAPSGRTNPTQLFPDSSQGFIGGELDNSYHYLGRPDTTSVTLFANSGSLEERGAAWLFLRWLGDLKDSTIYGKLDQTSLIGTANIAAQAGETFQALFGDFAMALYSDSLPGMPRASAPARDRYVSRNLRQIYARLNFTDPGNFPFAFPVPVGTVPVQAKTTSSMIVGTMTFWKLTMPSSGSEVRLHFAANGGGTFPVNDAAQVSVLHCPSASACP